MKKLTWFISVALFINLYLPKNPSHSTELGHLVEKTECSNETHLDLPSISDAHRKIKNEERFHTNIDGFITDLSSYRYNKIYIDCISPHMTNQLINKRSSVELREIILILIEITFYNPKKEVVFWLHKIILELKARNEEYQSFIVDLYKSYISIRDFDSAKSLSEEFIHLPVPPNISFKTDSDVLLFDVNIDNIRNVKLNGLNGKFIIIFHPKCAFSNSFFSWLEKRPSVRKMLSFKAYFISSADDDLALAQHIALAKKFEELQFGYFYDKRKLESISYWGTPSFYFYEDNSLKKQFIGWRNNNDKNNELIQFFYKIVSDI